MSGRKNALSSYHLVNAADMAATSITSNPVNILFLDNIGIQFNGAGAPAGVFTIQVSVDHKEFDGAVITAGNWVTLAAGEMTISGNSGSLTLAAAANIFVSLKNQPAPWVRVVYTKTSGTGTLDVYVSAKAI